jgi:uncharacterized repeat protein (TIGR02543 family)
VTSDITLYAKWTSGGTTTYTVTFNSLGGSTVSSITSVTSGSTITPPTPPARSGYTFAGWYKVSTCVNAWNFSSDTVTGNITLYAKWTGITTYTVTFNSQGGNIVSSITNVAGGSSIAEPTPPTRSGYTFAGWYREASCVNAWNFSSDTVTGNVVLYAKWTGGDRPANCIVLFHSRGGSDVPDQTVDYGTRLTIPTNPTRPYYVFAGWYKEAACINPWDFNDGVTSSMILYAKWSASDIPPGSSYPPTTLPTTPGSGGGGCDAGFAGLGAAALPALLVERAGKKKQEKKQGKK